MRKKSAVSEIIGTVLLLGISVTLFSIVYISVLTVPETHPTPSANIVCEIVDGGLVFTHLGGKALSENTKIVVQVPADDTSISIVVKDNMNSAAKADGLWNVGEKVRYHNTSLLGRAISYNIVDVGSNAIVVAGSTPAIDPIITFVDSIIPLVQTGSTLDLSASSTGTEPDNVTLFYKWNGFWLDSFENDDSFVSAYHNMSFDQGDYAEVNRSGEGVDIIDYVQNQNVSVDGENDVGHQSNFANQKNSPLDGTDTLTEVNVNPLQIDYVDEDTSNVDSSPDIGSHSNFADMQSGPDDMIDNLKESSSTSESWGITANWFYTASDHENYRYMGGISPNNEDMVVTSLHIRYYGSGTVSIALYTGDTLNDPTTAVRQTGAYNVAVNSGWNEIDVPDIELPKNTVTWIGWCHEGGDVYYEDNSAYSGDFQSLRGRWSQDTPGDADETNPMPANPGSGSFSNYWYAVYAEYKNKCKLDLEVSWNNVAYDNDQETLSIFLRENSNSHSLECSGGYMRIGDGFTDWGSEQGTISFWMKFDNVEGRPWGQHSDMELRFAGSELVLDWGGTSSLTSSTSFVSNKWYFFAVVWNENTNELKLYVGDKNTDPSLDAARSNWNHEVSNEGVTGNNFMASRGGIGSVNGYGDDLRYYDTDRSLTEIKSDYDIQLGGNEPYLQSYFPLNNDFSDWGENSDDGFVFGSTSFSTNVAFTEAKSPSEDLQVEAWDGSSWHTVIPALTAGWNNVSVKTYLDSNEFTIRFKDTEDIDTTQDSWGIDCALLSLLSNPNYRLSLQFNWTDVDFHQPNEELCIHASSIPSENLEVAVWDEGTWHTVIPALTAGWNNVSVKSYLDSNEFSIRFKDTEDIDTTQDSWGIDSTLLHLWEPGGIIFYEGNITSESITKPNDVTWSRFNVIVDNPQYTRFKILDENGAILPGYDNLNGDNNDISGITVNSIKLFGSFDGPVKLQSWNVTLNGGDWQSLGTDSNGNDGWTWTFSFPYTSIAGYYYFYSIGKKTGWPAESVPVNPNFDARCKYEV